MFGLPIATDLNKPLPKKAVFEKFNLKTAERDQFDADISRMMIASRIAPSTLPAVAEGETIKGFYVVTVALKHKDFKDQNILLLHKLINQKIIFALQYENETQFAVFHTRLLKSGWLATEDVLIPLQGLNFDTIWENIVADIGSLSTLEQTLEEQILEREHQRKLHMQLVALEKKCRTEKQPRKKYELHQQIVKIRKELK